MSIIFSSTAQNLDWVKQVGYTGGEMGQQIATDNQGNIFIAGSTSSDSLNIYGTTVSTMSNSINKIFIVKCDSANNILWANFYSSSGLSLISDICVDQQGNCVVIGVLFDSLFIVNDTLTAPTFDPTGYMLSINSVGGLNWHKHLASTCELNPRKVVTDFTGNIYTCGRFYCNGQFDTISVNTVGYENFYIAKFSSGGNGLWVKNGTGRNMRTLDYSSTGIVRACTQYYDTLTVGNTTTYANNPYETSAIISYDSTGYLELIMNIGHAATGSSSSFITGLSSDLLNNIYISGTFDSTNVFADTTISSFHENDIFILKVNSVGPTYSFNRFGGIHNDIATSLITDDYGVSYLCGSFPGAISFEGNWYFTAGSTGLFVCRLDSSLNVDWVMYSDNNNTSEASDFSLAQNGSLYVTGTMNGPLDWANWNLNTFGAEDIWVAHISDLSMGSAMNQNQIAQGIKIYPNPSTGSISINELPESPGTIEVCELQGKMISSIRKEKLTKELEMKLPLQSGVYMIRFISDDKTKVRYGKLIRN